MTKKIQILFVLILIASFAAPASAKQNSSPSYLPVDPVTFTVLHTNDFHGNLEQYSGGSSSNPGSARVAYTINQVRASVGAEKVLLFDAGDIMQGSLLSNLQKGLPTIDVYNNMGYNGATFGNHEFDWGQTTLIDRVTQAEFPFLSANIVSGTCDATNWVSPSFAEPYVVKTIGTAPNAVNVGIIGVTSTETPIITIPAATAGLCFKDPADSILHYYDELKAQSDVIIVLSHIGFDDGGYGYGIPVYGDKKLAEKLNTAGKPANLIIGGHSHTTLTSATVVGTTTVVQAAYNGRRVGRADFTVNPNGSVTIVWTALTPAPAGPADPDIEALIADYVNDPDYQTLINTEIGWTNVPLVRNYDGDSVMGVFINDSILNYLNEDANPDNNVDMVFNNSGGFRTDITCAAYPCKLNYGMTFSILPYGNQTIVGDMKGARILELVNQGAALSKGAIQVAGIRYKFFHYKGGTPLRAYSWGAYDVCVINQTTDVCEPLDLQKTYRIATNEFLAPAGQDNFLPFKYVTNISYYGDMLNIVNAYVHDHYTSAAPFNGALDGRITREGNDASGPIIPITVLHHNDSHGNLAKGTYVGYTQLATLIKQEKAYNPDRTLLISSGDNIQGDAMMYFFKSAPSGYSVDGTPLPVEMGNMHPMMAAMNSMNYDAMTLGNHEFNFGSDVFKSVMGQANFPILQANLTDDGTYGIASVPVEPYVEKTVGPEGIKVAILGIGNHRVPNYELPSNIPGLTFTDPIASTQGLATALRPTNDVVLALTHIGFTTNPSSVEVDNNVDTYLATQVTGLDAIVGGHSHTDPKYGFGDYKFLPTIVGGPGNTPVVINHAYRYNNTLGEVFIGLRAKDGGGYEVVSRAGQYLQVLSATAEDPAVKAIVDPYVAMLNTYNNTELGQTTAPIDALQAYTQETNGANLQADAAVHELESNGIEVDFHLSGAMSNRKVAAAATPAAPVMLKVSDMFSLMPYENSLVVLSMNGPQLKAVLERAYRNYYYYKYVSGYGGYSYYTTCHLVIDEPGQITYNDLNPALPNGNNVLSLKVNGNEIDFSDADTYYKVSTVNYLAAGSCNFNDSGVSLWPLNQIANDTQFYVRDAVIHYLEDMVTISPAIEGRLQYDGTGDMPVITINAPTAKTYQHTDVLTLDFSATDQVTGIDSVWADLDGEAVIDGQEITLSTLPLGNHTLTVYAEDKAGNQSQKSVAFSVTGTMNSITNVLNFLYSSGEIDNYGIYRSLLMKLHAVNASMRSGNNTAAMNQLRSFIYQVNAQSGKHISEEAADLLIANAEWLIDQLLGSTSLNLADLANRTINFLYLPTIQR